MKDFKDFKSYVSNHSDEIHHSIHQKVLNAVNEKLFAKQEKSMSFIVAHGLKLELWKCQNITITG